MIAMFDAMDVHFEQEELQGACTRHYIAGPR